MEQIKDCPFCGRKTPDDLEDTLYPSGGYWRETDGMRHYVSHRERKPGDSQCWTMHCGVGGWRCGAQITADTREEAIAAWNRRAAIQQAAGAVPAGEVAEIVTNLRDTLACCRNWSDPDEGDDSSVFPVRQVDAAIAAADKYLATPTQTAPLGRGGVTDERLWELRAQAKADPRCAEQHWFVLFARAVLAEPASIKRTIGEFPTVATQPPKPQDAAPVAGMVLVPVEVVHLYNFMETAFTPMTPQHDQIKISLDIAKKAMSTATPAGVQPTHSAGGAGVMDARPDSFHSDSGECGRVQGPGPTDAQTGGAI